jgi:hypothetical protein
MSSVEAEKRDLLFRQFEEQDRASREEAIRAERVRNEYVRREKEAAEHSKRLEEKRIIEEKIAAGIGWYFYLNIIQPLYLVNRAAGSVNYQQNRYQFSRVLICAFHNFNM